MTNGNASQRQIEAWRSNAVRAREARLVKAEREFRWLLEDLAELMDLNFCGETDPDVIARRLGYAKKTSLSRKLYRHGEKELARVFGYRYDPAYYAQYRAANAERIREWNRRSRDKRRGKLAA